VTVAGFECEIQQVEDYSRDGVVCLRQAIGRDWIETLRAGVERNVASPTERGRVWNRDALGHTCFYDSQAWRQIGAYRDFIEKSPLAEIAGRLMNVSRINFFFDAVFVRTPGTKFRTPWHQDEPYWSVAGFDACSVWMPLVPVAKKSALEFVRGSHRWPEKFRQTNFGSLTNDERDQVSFQNDDTVPFPDIEGHRDDFDIVSWDMQPGDCVVFNARIIHGGSGNLDDDRELKVFNTQWLGDDVRIAFREGGMDPDHSGVMTQHGLKPGDRPGGELYPELWVRPN